MLIQHPSTISKSLLNLRQESITISIHFQAELSNFQVGR